MQATKFEVHLSRLFVKFLRFGILVVLVIYNSFQSKAQFMVFTGVNSVNVKNDGLLQNQQPTYGVHFGFAMRHYSLDSLKKFSVQYELSFNQKGYQQKLDEVYFRRFNYISAPLLINYSPIESITLSTGFETSYLLFTNAVQGYKTYNRFDVGVVLGLSVLENRRLSVYTRFTYGLVPMLDYYTFDELGNFTDEIHDLQNLCFTFGLKFNIIHEKISFNF